MRSFEQLLRERTRAPSLESAQLLGWMHTQGHHVKPHVFGVSGGQSPSYVSALSLEQVLSGTQLHDHGFHTEIQPEAQCGGVKGPWEKLVSLFKRRLTGWASPSYKEISKAENETHGTKHMKHGFKYGFFLTQHMIKNYTKMLILLCFTITLNEFYVFSI